MKRKTEGGSDGRDSDASAALTGTGAPLTVSLSSRFLQADTANRPDSGDGLAQRAASRLSRKEVFQPHLPVRLPCYDLAPVTCLTLGRSSRSRTSGTPGFHGLTGGVYKGTYSPRHG